MPSTPTTARNSSTRRKSTKPSLDDPSTSFESPTEDGETITKKDEIRAFLVGRLLAMMRDHRDSTESKIAEKAADKIAPLNEHIYKLEQRACGMTLEEMVKDTQYASYSILNVAGEISSEMEKEKAALKNQKTLEPIEVKIEDTVVPQPESNVERAAKREAHVLARIAELRRNGMWSNSRLPKCVEPERNKTHWDYLLEEVKWMATDFRAEMSMKRQTARKLASAIAKVHREQEIEVERSEQKAIRDKKKLCASVAKMVRDFWQNVNKVVDIRAKEVIESRVRKERNKHLMLIIGQVNEMSTIVQEGLQKSKTPSVASNADDEFSVGEESESDDERTIANAEKSLKTREVKDEVDALTSEANANIDDVLASLPPEYLAAYGVTSEDIEEMKRQNVAVEQEEVQEEEEEQDEKKENNEGNGDGRGVLQNVNYEKLNSVNSDERQKELANIAEEALKFQPKGYTLETTQVKTPVPFLVRGTLREYQMVGLDWLVTLYEKNLNGILADEMGLGKTIQTISLLAHLACSESIWGPHLIVVPTSVILNWEMEFKKWCPALKILTYFGSAKDRAEKRKGWLKPNCFHVCITSYKTVTTDIRVFKKRGWQYMILDEAQNIKNWKSQRWQALLNVRARRRLLLTGTPLQNSLMELWSLMHFLMPTIFSSHDDFQDWFSNPLTGMMEGNAEFNAPLIQQLHKVLRPFILRRLKSEVEKQLPAKTEHIIKCSLSKRQRYLYDDFMSRRSTKENLKSGNMMSVLNIVMQLRKCCNHPNLFEPRQVVSPFVLNPRRQELPACLFEMTRKDNDDENIPDCLNIMKRVNAHGTAVRSKKPLIEEMEDEEEVTVRPPLVEGFKLNRTCFEEHSEMEASEEERAGFHCRMAAETSRLKLKEHGAMSPPIKKPKLTGTAPNLSDYVPRYVIERMEKEKRNRLEIARRRFDKIEEPILSAEVLSILRVKGKHAGRQEKRMMKFIEMAAERFGLYVEPVLTDAFECRPSSSGLPSYIRNNMEMVEVVSKSMLQQQSELDDRLLVSRMLQFPELRLIEYDCGKLQTLALLLRQLYLHKHRCLIFTQMSRMLDVLQMFLAHHGYQYFRLDGSTGIEQRQAMMERFNADEKIFCFILSTRSGGVGVNLTGADTVIFYDSDWNPTMDAQAQDRCHRIGQTRNVSIYRLISERTIEENILKKAIQKRRLGELAIDQAGFTPDFFKQSDSIRDLFTGENVDVQDPLDVPSNEKELESAMANCEDDVDVTATKMATAEANVDTAEFEEAAKNATTSHLGNEEDVDEKYLELINQLKPIERYAVGFMEEEYKPEFEEEEKEALALIEQKREEWNQKAEQQVAEDVDDDDFYLGGNLLDEVRKRRGGKKGKRKKANANGATPPIKNRSPSKRRSVVPPLTPYVSAAPHALGSPPASPPAKRPAVAVTAAAPEKQPRKKAPCEPRPSLGIYEKPRISYRARSDSDPVENMCK